MADLAERLEAAANGRRDWLAELLREAAAVIKTARLTTPPHEGE